MKSKRSLRILVTAGPTREGIDPVRFVSNRSTGVMGYEIAAQGVKRKHTVTLISGPTGLKPPKGVKFIAIETADDLKKAVLSLIKKIDCLFMVAAVGDWRSSSIRKKKIKRKDKNLRLTLEPTEDILAQAGRRKGRKVFVGFSLETKPDISVSRKKLKKKNLDLIVQNSFSGADAPFGDKRIKSFIMYKTGEVERLPLLPKKRIAHLLLDIVEGRYFGS